MGFCDRAGYEAIAAALLATTAFDYVLSGRNAPEAEFAAGQYPRCEVLPRGFREVSSVDPEQPVRTVNYGIVLTIRPDPGCPVEAELERLAAVVQDTLGGNALGGALPGLSIVAEGRYSDVAVAPEFSIVLSGSFAYLVDGFSGRDEDPDS